MSNKLLIVGVLAALAAYSWSGLGNKKGKQIKDGIIVKTGSGSVQGMTGVSRDGREFLGWHRIPFARAPVGNLRFADPLPPENWGNVIDGREVGPKCAQLNLWDISTSDVVLGKEDCLHLNVFVAKQLYEEVVKGQKPKQNVIVYIHGGGYVGGSCEMFNPDYIMDEDVVAVSINYRLEILGFLTTGDKNVRGNMGLKDQAMALKWIKKNIHYFGGDPDRVTIFGTSAGSHSVHMQMLSPMSHGLFQKVFAQSGSALATWGVLPTSEAIKKTEDTAIQLNCPTGDNKEVAECLRNTDLTTLLLTRMPLKTGWYIVAPHLDEVPFGPTIEVIQDAQAFLTEDPATIIKDGKAQRVPLMIGHTTHEGLATAGAFIRNAETLPKFEAVELQKLKQLFGVANADSEDIVKKIHQLYFPPTLNKQSLSTDEKINIYTDVFSDAMFNFDTYQTVLHQRKFSPVYYYLHNKTDSPDPMRIAFEITGKLPIMVEVVLYLLKSFFFETLLGIPPKFYGINHALDCYYYYSFMHYTIPKGSKFYGYSKDLVKLLVDFAQDDSNMQFRGQKFPPVPKDGELTLFEFRKEDATVSSPPSFFKRMEYLQSLNLVKSFD